MALDGKLLRLARERLAARKDEHIAAQAALATSIRAAVPELAQIEAAQRALLGELLTLTLHADGTDDTARLQARSDALWAEKRRLLTAHGYPADALDAPPLCPRCGDTGYLRSGAACDCLMELYAEEQAKAFSSLWNAGEDRFEAFRLDYYTGEDRACMELTYRTAKAYAESFGADSANLLFQGGTGLGKTFLSGCIARVVSARGYSVVYETAQDAFAAFEAQKFSRDGDAYSAAAEQVRQILGCDLLILDDLGTELTTGFTQSALYQIVNSRLTARKKTIISTNLSDGELAARYIPQTVSRISGEYDTLLFMGRDVRAIRKEHRYG